MLPDVNPYQKITAALWNALKNGLANGTADAIGNQLARFRRNSFRSHVTSGLVASTTSTALQLKITAGEVVINGKLFQTAEYTAAMPASSTTYVWLKDDGVTFTPTSISGSGAQPTPPTNTDGTAQLLVVILATDANVISVIRQGGYDSYNNVCYPTSPLMQQDPWQNISYQSGWGPFDTNNYGYPQYFKDSMGFVHMRGLIRNPTASTNPVGSVMFYLPPGYRPGFQTIFSTNYGTGTAPDPQTRINVDVNGSVSAGVAITGGNWASMAPIRFRADN